MKTIVKFFEIIAVDFQRAVNFYNSLLKINLDICECGDDKMAFFPHKEGAISCSPGFYPSKDGTIITLKAVEPLNQMLERAKELGGSVVMDITKISNENSGSFALILDTEGNRIGLYSDE